MEKTDKGVRVMVKGQPKTEEVIPLGALESINRAAYAYTGKWLGPKEETCLPAGRPRLRQDPAVFLTGPSRML